MSAPHRKPESNKISSFPPTASTIRGRTARELTPPSTCNRPVSAKPLDVVVRAATYLSSAVIAHHNSRKPELDSFLGVLNCLDTLEHNWSIPVLLQEFDIFPAVTEGWKNSSRPLSSGGMLVIFDLFPIFGLELRTKDWI